MESKFYKEKTSVDKYIQMAKGHDGRGLIQMLKPFLDEHAKVLEIGSGPGTDFGILSTDFKVVGSDYSPEFLIRLKESFPKETFLELDAETLLTKLSFDVIYSNKVLHHLTDVELSNSIKHQYEILNTSGIVCHSFWKGNGTENYNGMYVNNHTKEELVDFFNPYFTPLVIECYQEFEENDSLIYIGKKIAK